jgi:hypothetical protein
MFVFNKLERSGEEVGMAHYKVLIQYSLRGSEENHEELMDILRPN